MSNFLFEIFSEELPATLQKKILLDYKQFSEKELKKIDKTILSENIFVGITLNRLLLIVNNINIDENLAKQFIDITIKDFSKTFPRTMCYPQLCVRWIRPIRSLFACIDGNILNGNFYGIDLKNGTYIQKFNFKECQSLEDYKNILSDEKIEVDYYKRFNFIKNEILNENISYNNMKLIEEITGMNEYCIKPMKSILDKKFYILPFELIELVLRENQRYVVFKKNNEIQFLIFGDKISGNNNHVDNIIKGHNKVVIARLEDALYYWKLDEENKKDKTKLYNKLYNRIFIEDLTWGSFLSKQQELLDKLYTKDINDCCNKNKILDLIIDTKLDLATDVVCEFPELQGIIGTYYFGYNFNPYMIDLNNKNINNLNIIYYYIVDRISYIQVMYQYGKQPTGNGDKYKVKARIDDVILLFMFFNKHIDLINPIINSLKENIDIYKLFIKRYQKIIEDKFKNLNNIKKFSQVCVNLIENGNFLFLYSNLEKEVSFFQNQKFMKIYKRIHGYTENVDIQENNEVEFRIKEILPDINNIESVNYYLDNNKIADDNITKQALKTIENKYFKSILPIEFLEISD